VFTFFAFPFSCAVTKLLDIAQRIVRACLHISEHDRVKGVSEWGLCWMQCRLLRTVVTVKWNQCELLNCWAFILSSQNIIQTVQTAGGWGWEGCERVTDEGGFVRWLRGDAQSPLNCILSTISRSMTKYEDPSRHLRVIVSFLWTKIRHNLHKFTGYTSRSTFLNRLPHFPA
jgi:hypothetical protein